MENFGNAICVICGAERPPSSRFTRQVWRVNVPSYSGGEPRIYTPVGFSVMKTYLVSFTNADGVSQARRVEALTAMLATRIAHNQVADEISLRDTVAIACTLIDLKTWETIIENRHPELSK